MAEKDREIQRITENQRKTKRDSKIGRQRNIGRQTATEYNLKNKSSIYCSNVFLKSDRSKVLQFIHRYKYVV